VRCRRSASAARGRGDVVVVALSVGVLRVGGFVAALMATGGAERRGAAGADAKPVVAAATTAAAVIVMTPSAGGLRSRCLREVR
jgi:hypothetical protein